MGPTFEGGHGGIDFSDIILGKLNNEGAFLGKLGPLPRHGTDQSVHILGVRWGIILKLVLVEAGRLGDKDRSRSHGVGFRS